MKYKKKQKRKKIIIISSIILTLILGFIILMIYLNASKNSYTFLEKRWINENKKNIIDLKINNEVPLFSYNGEGIYYDFIKDLEKDTTLSFSFVSTSNTPVLFDMKNTYTDNDIIFYKDHYVVISKKDGVINSYKDLEGKELGVVSTSLADLSYYLKNEKDLNFKTYETYTNLKDALAKDIEYAVIPLNLYLNDIISNNFKILYHIDDAAIYYTLSVKEENKELKSIFDKFFKRWNQKYKEKINTYFLDSYYTNADVSEINKDEISSRDYIVGYVNNLPYEGDVAGKLSGFTNTYLKEFSELTGVTYKYEKFKELEVISKELEANKLDLILNYDSLKSANYTSSNIVRTNNYVILVNIKDDSVVNSIYSLKGKTVSMLKNKPLTIEMKNNNIFGIKEYENTKLLLKDIKEEDIIIIDEYAYNYYKNTKLSNFTVRYTGLNNNNYSFLLNNNNEPFNNLFNFFLTYKSGKELGNTAVNDANVDLESNTLIGFIINNIFYIVVILLAILIVLWRINSRIRLNKKLKKDDKLMYLDVMTNLKNRAYLNDNIELWDTNRVYPQTIIVIDLKKVKHINDTSGHEEGDRQIRQAANVLIKTQRENSEIIRTDGNEFLIYLVGYEEKLITSYLHKLNKEFKSLPYDYGVAFGYAMIENEQTTIDDAINDASIMMRKNKEEL